jgi:4-hydroxy-L-threonine phosphate dehydrogenase PdxA
MKIGITIGDCNGISHEILFKSLNGLINLAVNDEIILYGNNEVIKDWLNIFCNLKSDNAECDKFSQFCK